MGPKYEFTGRTWHCSGDHLLHRIRRLSDGKLGGWIESEDNLSQEGNCWIDDEASVYGHAKVYGNAYVGGKARVYDNAKVFGNARVYGNDLCFINNNAKIYDNAEINDNVCVDGNAKVYGDAQVCDNAQINDDAEIYDSAKVLGNAVIYNNAKVYGHAEVYGYAEVYDNAKVHGDVKVFGDDDDDTLVCGYIEITSGEYTNGKFSCDEDSSKNSKSKTFIQDFIYKVDNSNKLIVQTEYNSVDEFFDTPFADDIKLDTLVICIIDTKEPLIKLQKIEAEDETEFKLIVEITNEDSNDFIFRSIIKSQEHLNQLIQRTVEALKQYPEFSKYADDLENCL